MMSVAVPRRRRLDTLDTALSQLHDTTQTMLDEITALQQELGAVNNADEDVFVNRTPQPLSPPGATTAQQARLDGRASLSPSFRPEPTRRAVSLGVTAQWFQDEAGRFGPHHGVADDPFAD